MNKEIHYYQGKTWERITKRNAEKLWNDGKEFLMQSSNMRFNTHWQSPCPMKNDGMYDTHIEGLTSFQNMCNHFEYYNCDNERGKYIKFYKEVV